MFKHYLSSSLHVAFALWAYCNVLALQQGLSVSASMQCAFFGFGWAAYQYTNQFVPMLYKKQAVSAGNIALFVVALVLGFWGLMAQPLYVWVVFFGIGILTFCYALPFGAHMGLRFVPTLKVFVVALSWTTLALLPLISLPKQVFVWVAAKSLLWILCLMLPFELRDVHKDAPSLKTVPQVIGVAGTKRLGFVLIFLCGLMASLTVSYTPLLYVEFAALLLLGLATYKANSNQSKIFASFWVESIPIFWFVASLLVLSFG